MGSDLCTCLTEQSENDEDIMNQNTYNSQKNSTNKILYINSQTSISNNRSISHRQKLYLNSMIL